MLGGLFGANSSSAASGKLITGSSNVRINGKFATMTTLATAQCSNHAGKLPVISGSTSVRINGMPAGRISEKISCSAVIVAAASPNVNIGGPSGEPTSAEQSKALAIALVQAGGSGDQTDVALVVAELAKLPAAALQILRDNGVKVIAARNSVTDYATELKGVHPRGWPPGATWDNVPGAYMHDRNAVVIATTGYGTPAGPHVPVTGEGHGSANMTVHETTHAVDAFAGPQRNSSSSDFTAARNSDLSGLSAYEQQAGAGGPSETYAESSARVYGGQHGPTQQPALDAYWRSHPLGGK
ncbi:PAAR domain-containing protein (plasmid) [Polymorphobacter sp. PAMC 29334]|nr:PAAR domain-containing protein [Polymorphobacter sp. PAMC 29334]